MTPRNYTDEELLREIQRCYTDEVVLELAQRFIEQKQQWTDDEAA